MKQVRWLVIWLVLTPLLVNANQIKALPDPELLEFLGRYSAEEQAWLELAMEQEQQKMKKDKADTVSVGEK